MGWFFFNFTNSTSIWSPIPSPPKKKWTPGNPKIARIEKEKLFEANNQTTIFWGQISTSLRPFCQPNSYGTLNIATEKMMVGRLWPPWPFLFWNGAFLWHPFIFLGVMFLFLPGIFAPASLVKRCAVVAVSNVAYVSRHFYAERICDLRHFCFWKTYEELYRSELPSFRLFFWSCFFAIIVYL